MDHLLENQFQLSADAIDYSEAVNIESMCSQLRTFFDKSEQVSHFRAHYTYITDVLLLQCETEEVADAPVLEAAEDGGGKSQPCGQ